MCTPYVPHNKNACTNTDAIKKHHDEHTSHDAFLHPPLTKELKGILKEREKEAKKEEGEKHQDTFLTYFPAFSPTYDTIQKLGHFSHHPLHRIGSGH